MEDLPESLIEEIVKRVTQRCDLNALSLVSKQLYTIEAYLKGTLRVGCGHCPDRKALASVCSRFPNLWKVEINYSGWTMGHRNQLDNKSLLVISSSCPCLTDLTLSFCSRINDSGLGYLVYCKKLMSLRLNSVQKITSNGLLSVVVGCKSLSALHLTECKKIDGEGWLEYVGWNGSLEELAVNNCKGISQGDLMKFGPGWMKLQKFVFEMNDGYWDSICILGQKGFDPSYNAHNPSTYDFCCDSLKDLRLACMGPERRVRVLLGKCKALEKLCLEYVAGLNDNDMIALSRCCSNLRSISLYLTPHFYDYSCRTSFTDDSLKALAISCPMLQAVELTFFECDPSCPSEIGFTMEGLLMLIKSCPVSVLVLDGANFFNDEGMEAISSAPFLETLELVDCEAITDAGMRFVACTPCLTNLTLRLCNKVTDSGVAELGHAHKLQCLIIEDCEGISEKAVQGAARSVRKGPRRWPPWSALEPF